MVVITHNRFPPGLASAMVLITQDFVLADLDQLEREPVQCLLLDSELFSSVLFIAQYVQ